VEYYRTKEGKFKKEIQNSKRGKVETRAGFSNRQTERDLVLDGCSLEVQMVCYVRMVTSLIEGRRVSVDEILQMLARAVRQHSMVRRRRIDYVLQHLHKSSP
jgi:5-methylcytosine-specific restriction endonuclease McrA